MTYDEFKENFLPEFLKIRSFAGKIRYANENLTRIGSGTGRIVFDIDGEKVLKLAKNPKGIAQNEAEAGAGYYHDTQHIVTEVFESADDNSWLVSEKANKVNEKRIKEVTGIPSLNDLYYFLRNFKDQNNGGRKVFDQDKEVEEFMWENEFAQDLANFIANYNQSAGDMGRPSTYGEVLRDGQPAIVLTDYGLNDEVYNTHYSPDRKKSRYQMYELYNYADGNDDILSDAGGGAGGNEIRTGMWAQMPYSVSDGGDNSDAVINEEFIDFVSKRDKYPDKPISSLPVLTDHFHECVNNINEIMRVVEDKPKFYNNLLELQNYLIRRGFYNRDPLLSEEYLINEDLPPVEYDTLKDNREYSDKIAKEVAGKLGLSTPRYLGGGGNGFAYEINNNIVLKLTTDISEADAASRLMRGQPKNIATIYKLYKVLDTETDKSIFALTQENIKDKPVGKLRKFQDDITKITADGLDYEDIMINIKKPARFNHDEWVEWAKKILTENPAAGVSELDRQAAYEYLVTILNIRQELLDFGIKSTDYITISNQGYSNGVLKFFDVGGYYGVDEPDIADDEKIQLPEDGSAKFTTDNAVNQDDFPVYNTNDTSPMINNDLDANSANLSMYEDLEYNHVKGDATEDEYMLSERNKSYGAGSKTVEVKKKCKLGGLGNTSVACNQGDINNLVLKSIKERLENGLDIQEYFSSLVPDMNEQGIMSLQDLPFKSEIEQLGGKIYSVGGAVRDEFLGKDSKDLDILITGIPMKELERLLTKYGKVNLVGANFGVLKFVPRGSSEEIDIAIPRTETATGGGGHKDFNVTSDHALPIEKDLERRDFTINAIGKDSDGNVIDPYGGQEDLKNKIIRIVNPVAFSDDPLRMLRAVQFASRFGFVIEPTTMDMIKTNAEKIKEIPPERILIELDKIVKKGNKRIGAQLLQNTGLFNQIFGYDLKPSTIDRSDFEGVKTMGEFLFLLTRLLPEPAEFVKNNLKGDIETYKQMKALQYAYDAANEFDMTKARIAAHNVYITSKDMLQSQILPELIGEAAQELLQGKYPKSLGELAVNGNDLIGLGLEGKEIGKALKNMLVEIYDGNVRNNKEELLSLVNQKPEEVKEGYPNYSDLKPAIWKVNGEDVTINFFVEEYDKWNYKYERFTDASRESVLRFVEDEFPQFVEDEKLKRELYWKLTDRDLLNEESMKKISYSAVVLDDKSRTKLLQVFKSMIPEGWEIIAHHMTINMGELDEKYRNLLNNDANLNVTSYAIDDLVMAVGVSGFPTMNKIPHITIAVNRAEGGKPFLSNKLTDWKPIGFTLSLTGKVNEVE